MDKDEPEGIMPKNEVTQLNAVSEEITLSEEDTEKTKEDYWKRKFMSPDTWAYISYYLYTFHILLWWLAWGSFIPFWMPYPWLFLASITSLSFVAYIYLSYNNDEFEFLPFNSNRRIMQIILFIIFVPLFITKVIAYSECVAIIFPNGQNYCSNEVHDFVILIPFLFIIASLSFKKKFLDDDTPKVTNTTKILEAILGFLGLLTILIGFVWQMDSGFAWNRIGTFADAIPCYAISFVLLIFMLAMRLNAKSSSQDSAKKEAIKADNWKKFKTKTIVLVVVFSLLMPLLWYESHTYWEDEKEKYIDLGEDCNDTIIGPDVSLVNADFSGMYLYGCDLSNRDLTGADFSGTHLKCVDFSNSILVGANFGFGGLVIEDGDTGYQTYLKNMPPNIGYVTFDNADLSDANFNGTGLYSVPNPSYYTVPDVFCPDNLSFKGANLTNADVNAYFSTRFQSEKLIFDNAILDNANFSMLTSYSHVSMVNVSFIGTNISINLPPGSNLSQSNMSEANFIDFMALDLASCPLLLPENYNCAEISGKKMIFGPSMDFSNKYISFYNPNSTFHGIPLSGSNMSNANLSNSYFSYSHTIYNQEYSDYNYYMEQDEDNNSHVESQLEEWGVDEFSDLKSLWAANLTNVNFTGANLSYSDFSYSNMLGANLENADLTGAIWYYTICPDGSNSGESSSCSAT